MSSHPRRQAGREGVLEAALADVLTSAGHLPWCNHRSWLHGFNNRKRHACDLPDCDGEGVACIPKCQAVRAALRADAPVQAVLL